MNAPDDTPGTRIVAARKLAPTVNFKKRRIVSYIVDGNRLKKSPLPLRASANHGASKPPKEMVAAKGDDDLMSQPQQR